MTVPTTAATNAYQATAKLAESIANGGNQAGSNPASAIGDSFKDILGQAVSSVTEGGNNVETQTMAAVQGKGDMIDVVTAVAETEVALQSMVSIRDRVISSYEEIMRMPI